MSVPSFLYSALDPETQRMAEELASLGGGNARAINMEVHCIIDDRLSRLDNQTIWRDGASVCLKEYQQLQGSPISESIRKYNFTGSYKLQDVLQSPTDIFAPVKSISLWLQEGFNACLIAYGERSAGKTSAMFGLDDGSDASGVGSEIVNSHRSRIGEGTLAYGGVAAALLKDYFSINQQVESDGLSSSGHGDCSISCERITIALSAWTLRGQQIVDVLSSVTKNDCTAMEFASIDCPTYEIAMKVLKTARLRARAHGSKYRIILHRENAADPAQSSLSHIHLVDLIGTSSADVAAYSKLQEDDRLANRDTSLQLQSLCKVLSEMKSLSEAQQLQQHPTPFSSSRSANKSLPLPSVPCTMQVTSARNSKLTCMLAPLLQGNCRTVFLAFLRDGESHLKQSKHTVSSLYGVTEILSACHRVEGIPLSAIPLRCPDSIFDLVQVCTRSGRSDLTRSLDSFHRYQGPADEQRFEPLRGSSPHFQKNKVVAYNDAEIENENRCDSSAALQFMNKAPKSVKLISAALQQSAESCSCSPPRSGFGENQMNKKVSISKAGVNDKGRGRYREGVVIDKGRGKYREENMQEHTRSEGFSCETSEADAEVGVEVEVLADKLTSGKEIDKLCGEFRFLLSALGGSLCSNDNISPSHENVVQKASHTSNIVKGKCREKISGDQTGRVEIDQNISVYAEGISNGDSSLLAAIQSMTQKQKDTLSEHQMGAIQNKISSQIRRLYMERAADKASLNNTADLSPPKIATLCPSSVSTSSLHSVADDQALNPVVSAIMEDSYYCEILFPEGRGYATSMIHPDISVTEGNEGRKREIVTVKFPPDQRESGGITGQSCTGSANSVCRSDRDDSDPAVHQNDRKRSELESMIVCSQGMHEEEEEDSREKIEGNIRKVHEPVEYTDSRYVRTYKPHKDSTPSMCYSNASPSVTQHRPSSDQGLTCSSTFHTASSESRTVRSSSSAVYDLKSLCGSDECSPEEFFLREQSTRSPEYDQLHGSKRGIVYNRRFDEMMAEEKGGDRPAIDPDDASPLGPGPRSRLIDPDDASPLGPGPRSRLIDPDDDEVDSTALGKHRSRNSESDEYYWEMKSDSRRSKTWENRRRYSKADPDVKYDHPKNMRERGCDEDEDEDVATVDYSIKEVAYFSDDSLTPHKKDPLGFSSRFSSNTDREDVSEGKDGVNEDRGALEDEEEDIGMSHFTKMSLSQSLKEERALRFRMSRRMACTSDEASADRMQLEMKIARLTEETILLQAQVRSISSQEPLGDVYDTFERHIQRLVAENESLRGKNLFLERNVLTTLRKSANRIKAGAAVAAAYLMDPMSTVHGVSANTQEYVSRGNSEKENGNTTNKIRSNNSSCTVSVTDNLNFDHTGDLISSSLRTQGGAVPRERPGPVSAPSPKFIARLRQAIEEKESFRQALEEMYSRERRYVLSEKIMQDASKRLKDSFKEAARFKRELNEERSLRITTQRDLALIKEDSLGLRESENNLRGARATTLGELSHLRERVREIDAETIVGGLFESKRDSGNVGSSDQIPPYPPSIPPYFLPSSSAITAVERDGWRSPPGSLQGVAGLSNAQYVRLEEITIGSAALERSLSVLHEGLIASCPSLLPAYRELYKDIQSDRSHSIQQRAAILSLSCPSSRPLSSTSQQLQRQSATDARLAYRGRSDGRRLSVSKGVHLTASTSSSRSSAQFGSRPHGTGARSKGGRSNDSVYDRPSSLLVQQQWNT